MRNTRSSLDMNGVVVSLRSVAKLRHTGAENLLQVTPCSVASNVRAAQADTNTYVTIAMKLEFGMVTQVRLHSDL
jgi:hypothetical protein